LFSKQFHSGLRHHTIIPSSLKGLMSQSQEEPLTQ
jgi:hypothetical protein